MLPVSHSVVCATAGIWAWSTHSRVIRVQIAIGMRLATATAPAATIVGQQPVPLGGLAVLRGAGHGVVLVLLVLAAAVAVLFAAPERWHARRSAVSCPAVPGSCLCSSCYTIPSSRSNVVLSMMPNHGHRQGKARQADVCPAQENGAAVCGSASATAPSRMGAMELESRRIAADELPSLPIKLLACGVTSSFAWLGVTVRPFRRFEFEPFQDWHMGCEAKYHMLLRSSHVVFFYMFSMLDKMYCEHSLSIPTPRPERTRTARCRSVAHVMGARGKDSALIGAIWLWLLGRQDISSELRAGPSWGHCRRARHGILTG